MERLYDTLRLCCGGGIKNAVEKVEQAKNTATLVIGIGGTGIDALRMAKKTIYEHVKQNNWGERDVEEPCYRRIQFLAIDSDKTNIWNPLPELDLSKEFKDIGVANIVQELQDKKRIISKPCLNWLNLDIDANRISGVARGNRQVSKYLLSKKASELYCDFRRMINSAITSLEAGFELNIYIMSGLDNMK